MLVLVTGASGFIGRSLMACLAREGLDARPYNGRLVTHIKLREHLEDVGLVVHLAGAEARGRNRILQQVDVDGTERLLDECRRAEIKHLIVVSRLGANPLSMHGLLRAKGEMERLVHQSEVPYTILRSATLYGRDDRFTEIILSLALWSWPFVWLPGGGKTPMQPLWVEDFARCLVYLLQHPDRYEGQTITVAGEERMHYRELVQRLLAVSGRKRLAVSLPMTLLRPSSRLFFQWWYRPPVSQYFVDCFFVPEVINTDTVLRHFGFRPSRLTNQIAYLRRSGLRRRLFRR
ncbi:MAG: NAD-dependent epimerase/dehydratase family protein [Chloroflexi bacterium]|nr:NAD-dependent epimerase/dehydratase family protein [Chloroflexota bacterium]